MAASQIEEYCKQFAAIQIQAKELVAGLSEPQFNWRPAPGQWSTEECLGHLIIAGQWALREIEPAIERAKARGLTGNGPFRFGPVERFMLNLTEPPVRRKLPAPRQFVPAHGQPITAILPTFLHLQSQFMLQLERADGLDLALIKLPSPISRFLRFSLVFMFAHTAAHERRHLMQARRVREQLPLADTNSEPLKSHPAVI